MVNIIDTMSVLSRACFLAPVAVSSMKHLLSRKICDSSELERQKRHAQRHLSICSSSAAGRNSWEKATFSAEKKTNACVGHHTNAQPAPLGSI